MKGTLIVLVTKGKINIRKLSICLYLVQQHGEITARTSLDQGNVGYSNMLLAEPLWCQKNLVISKWIHIIEFSTLWPNIHPRKILHTGRIDIGIFKETLLVTENSGNNPNKKPALWQHVHSREHIKNSLNFYLFIVLGIAVGALFMQHRSSTKKKLIQSLKYSLKCYF